MNYYLTLALLLLAYMSLWFVISLIKKRNDVADVDDADLGAARN